MRKIPLTRGQFALVDDADFELASRYRWHLRKSEHRRTCYASAYTKDGEIHLHRLILQPSPGQLVDHRDGDGLNNTRANLRICTHRQNLANRPPSRLNTSGYKGVHLKGGRWRARIHDGTSCRHLGMFNTPQEAARAYDAAAREAFGEFAYLNFPEQVVAV